MLSEWGDCWYRQYTSSACTTRVFTVCISTPRQRGTAFLIDVEMMRRSMINGVVSVDGGVIDIQLVWVSWVLYWYWRMLMRVTNELHHRGREMYIKGMINLINLLLLSSVTTAASEWDTTWYRCMSWGRGLRIGDTYSQLIWSSRSLLRSSLYRSPNRPSFSITPLSLLW